MDKEAKIAMYLEYLRDEGFRPTTDDDGDVKFKMEGGTYYISADMDDDPFFRIIYPNFWDIESSEELERAYRAANYASMETKVAKVYVRRDETDVHATIEIFVSPSENFRNVFMRAMSALQTAKNTFRERMHQTEPQPTSPPN